MSEIKKTKVDNAEAKLEQLDDIHYMVRNMYEQWTVIENSDKLIIDLLIGLSNAMDCKNLWPTPIIEMDVKFDKPVLAKYMMPERVSMLKHIIKRMRKHIKENS